MTYIADFHAPQSTITAQSVTLEENILGTILFDPGAIAVIENLAPQVFEIPSHQTIWRAMVKLHRQGIRPDLNTVAFRLSQSGRLQEIGGQSKLAQLYDRILHSGNIKQDAQTLQENYYRRCLSENFRQAALMAEASDNLGESLEKAEEYLERIKTVTGDSCQIGDTQNLDVASVTRTVTTVTDLLKKGLDLTKEQVHLDAIGEKSGMSKTAFNQLVAMVKCQLDEVSVEDKARLEQLIDWQDAKLDFTKALPSMASDLLHDGKILNVDPIALWQYLLPAVLSLVGKKADLDIGSHRVPAIAWTALVGESGTGKTRAESVVLAPLKEWQYEESQRLLRELNEYKKATSKKGGTPGDGEEPTPPRPERKYLYEVATIQAVMRRLAEQEDNGTLWARDELGGLFKSLGQFTKGEGEGVECLLKLWDGAPAQVDRVLIEQSFNTPTTRLSIGGGIQPGIFSKAFKDSADANGLQARFLFALISPQPPERVKGYCRLSDKLPVMYRWIDQSFPATTLKLSRAADARYDAIFRQIGLAAEKGRTPAIRNWLRKLPTQVLRIAIALHVIECYHQQGRPTNEIQLDTLERAVEFAKYYRSVFQCIQESLTDSDDTSSILAKIQNLAASSPDGLNVRDAYRGVKAIGRRAKELGLSAAAYTMEMFAQLQNMGKGAVERCGRVVKYWIGVKPGTSTPTPEPVTVVTEPPAPTEPEFEASPPEEVSPVTNKFGANFQGEVQPPTDSDSPPETLSEQDESEWRARMKACCTPEHALDFYALLRGSLPAVQELVEQLFNEEDWARLNNLLA